MSEKILVVGLTGGIGGVEHFICNVNSHIDRKKYSYDFLVHQGIADMYVKKIRSTGGEIYTISGIKQSPFNWLRDILTFFKRHTEYRIIHLHECSAVFFAYVFPILFDSKRYLIVHSHNGYGSNSLIHSALKPVQNLRTNYRCACSKVAADWMFGKNSNYAMIHNGIDPLFFRYNHGARLSKRIELGISENDLVFGSIARFDAQKNHMRIIDIYKYFRENKFNQVKLVLVGMGQDKSRVENRVHEYNLDDDVLFLENREDVNELLSAFDLMLMPSLFEGLPFVALEAQASALPLLMSDSITREVAITKFAEYESLDNSDELWCNHIINMLEKNTNRGEVNVDPKFIEAGFDIKNTVCEIEKIYDIALEYLGEEGI